MKKLNVSIPATPLRRARSKSKIPAHTSWLDGTDAAQKAAQATSTRGKNGRPFGAERFRFTLEEGTGEVVMTTRVRASRQVLVSIPADTLEALKEATGKRLYTAGLVGLADWALAELQRRKKKITISDADG